MDEKQLEELIEKAWEKFYDAGGLRPTFSKWHVCEVFKSALREVFGEVTSRSLQGWISVEDKLPEDCNEAVLALVETNSADVFGETRRRYVAHYFSGHWLNAWNNDTFGLDRVTHWQPLPSPPVDLGKADNKNDSEGGS